MQMRYSSVFDGDLFFIYSQETKIYILKNSVIVFSFLSDWPHAVEPFSIAVWGL